MSRNSRDSLIGGGRSMLLIHRRGHSVNGPPNLKDFAADRVDLFSKGRRTVASSDESDVSLRLGRLSVGSAKQANGGSDDLLSSGGEKHDYDWLLTPPGTPMGGPSSNGNEPQTSILAPRGRTLSRSTSTTKASQLSTSRSEHIQGVKPARSTSVTRPSFSGSRYSTYSSKSISILNTSSASVSSYTTPTTPTTRSLSVSRPSTPSSRPSVSRSTTPSKSRSAPTPSTLVDKPRPSINSRPSTPTSRPQTSANSNGNPSRITASRPSTPIRHHTTTSSSSISVGPSTNGGRSVSNGRSITSGSCPSSPGPRVKPPPQPILVPDLSFGTTLNVRSTLPDNRRPVSAGRSRPGVATAAERNEHIPSNTRRQPSPMFTHGNIAESMARSRILANGHLATEGVDSRRELSTRRPLKTSSESTGFGRTISKSSLDMAIRHMDIRNGSNGLLPAAATKLFPQSIRSIRQKNQSCSGSVSSTMSGTSNDATTENNGGYRHSESGIEEVRPQSSAKLINPDIYESSRYDMMLLKEDLKNTNWLHSIDDKPDQEFMFDNGFGPLPEPFSPF